MLIDNQEIKDILIKDLLSTNAVKEKSRDMERTLGNGTKFPLIR